MNPSEQQLAQLSEAAQARPETLAGALSAVAASEQLAAALRRLARQDREQYADRAARAAQTHAFNLAAAAIHSRSQNQFPHLVHYGQQASRRLRKVPGSAGTRAHVLADLAVGYVEFRRLRSAARTNRKAQRLLRALVRSDPQRYLGVLADTYYTASGIAGLRGNHRAGIALAERAVNLFQEAARLDPDAYVPYQRALDSLLRNVGAFGSRRDLRRIRRRHSG